MSGLHLVVIRWGLPVVLAWMTVGCMFFCQGQRRPPELLPPGDYGYSGTLEDSRTFSARSADVPELEGATLTVDPGLKEARLVMRDGTTLKWALAPTPEGTWPVGCLTGCGGVPEEQVLISSPPSPLEVGPYSLTDPRLHVVCVGGVVVSGATDEDGGRVSFRFNPLPGD